MTEPTQRIINPPVHCPECGFEGTAVNPGNGEATVRDLGRRYQAPLTRSMPGEDLDRLLRLRPAPDTWSALEYAAHVRDGIALWGSTLHLALTEDRPHIPLPDPDIADRFAAEAAYNRQEPRDVSEQLTANANRMAAKIATIATVADAGVDGWDRTVVIGDEEMSALAIVRKVAHEGGHHLLDVGRSLRVARASRT
jgi:hypothetical protein